MRPRQLSLADRRFSPRTVVTRLHWGPTRSWEHGLGVPSIDATFTPEPQWDLGMGRRWTSTYAYDLE